MSAVFVEDWWAQCDHLSCRKWRRLPPGTIVDNNAKWYCRMNPDTRYNSCEIPEELYDEKNEILLKDQEWRPEKKTRKKRKTEVEKQQGSTGVTQKRISNELQRRYDKLVQLRDESCISLKTVKPEDLQLLQLHSPDALDAARKAADAKSALEYFQPLIRGGRVELLGRMESCAIRLGIHSAIEEIEKWRGDYQI